MPTVKISREANLAAKQILHLVETEGPESVDTCVKVAMIVQGVINQVAPPPLPVIKVAEAKSQVKKLYPEATAVKNPQVPGHMILSSIEMTARVLGRGKSEGDAWKEAAVKTKAV